MTAPVGLATLAHPAILVNFMNRLLPTAFITLALVLVPAAQAAPDAMPAGIAWKQAHEVDAAFAQAKKENKPIFLYWGAVWCPPCNQVKATVFSRSDFIERAKLFVPVYIDGDAPTAQALGGRFKTSGYPTMILFRPDGSEVTRLPGEVDGARYMQVLQAGLAGGRDVRSLLAAARAGKALSANDWQLLGFYSWETDEQALLPRADRVATLWQLAQRSSRAAPEASARLALKAAAVAASDSKSTLDKPAALQRVRAALADARVSRANFPELAWGAERLPAYLTEAGTPARAQLLREWDQRLLQFASDGALSRLDRLAAANGRVGLARVEVPTGALPVALQTEVRAVSLLATREVTDRYEREAIITSASSLLADAGLLDESDAMLQAELRRSATPYYHMLGLASNARKRGDNAAAVRWHEQAYTTSKGPATRLQWGASYVRALIDLAPEDAERIERAARSVLGELTATPESFDGRNRNVLGRMTARLNDWNKDGRHDAVLARLRQQLNGVCEKLPAQAPERASCGAAFNRSA